jgi:hypothetical protein
MSHIHPYGRNTVQRGQALTEFLVAALAIIPICLLIPLVAKYQDISHATQMASRYAAFDATVNNDSTGGFKSGAALSQEVRRRFFSNIDAPIKTNDVPGNFKAHQNLFWRGPADEALIQDINSVGVSLVPGGSPNNPVQSTAGARYGLANTPLYRADISVPLVNMPANITSYQPFDALNLRIDRQTTVMVDPWNARDLSTTRSRVRHGVPVSSVLSSVDTVLTLPFVVLELNKVSPPQVGRLELWDDVVPQDRLRSQAP